MDQSKLNIGLNTTLNPITRDTMWWLENMLPGVQGLEAFWLLSRPMPTIAYGIYGFCEGTRSKSLPDRMQAADKGAKTAGGCLILLTLVCLFVPPVFLVPGALVIACLVASRQRVQARKRVRAVFDSLWSVDTWLTRPLTPAVSRSGPVGANWQQRPPPLPFGVRGGKSGARAALSPFIVILIVCGSCVFLFFTLVLVGALMEPTGHSSPEKKPDGSEATTAADDTGVAKPTPEVRRAVPVRSSIMPSIAPAGSRSALIFTDELYTVVGVTNGDVLNVRAGPGANNNVVAKLPNGTTHVRVTGTPVVNGATEWVPIKVGDRTGWVTKQHLQRE